MLSNFVLRQWVSIPAGDDDYMWCTGTGEVSTGKYYMNATIKPGNAGDATGFAYMNPDNTLTNYRLSAFNRTHGDTIP
jgi:hypothetical protein